MQAEAEITVNGTKLTDAESMVVRVALVALADILAEGLGFKDDGILLTDRYQADLAHVQTLIEGGVSRTQ